MSGKLTDHIGKDKVCTFVHFQDNTLWYRTDAGLEFPIASTDTGSGIFLPVEKSIYLMRWIRKQLDFLDKARQENEDLDSIDTSEEWQRDV